MANGRNNGLGSLAPSSAIVTLTPAIGSAIGTGLAQGTRDTIQKSTEVIRKSAEAKGLLKTLQEMIKEIDSDFPDIQNDFSGLDIFKNSLNNGDLGLFDSVDFSRQKLATIPQIISQGMALFGSHLTQSMSDTVIGTGAGIYGKSVGIPKDVSLGSRLDEKAAENFFACSQHFSKNVDPLLNDMQKEIRAKFEPRHSALESHEMAAEGTGFVAFGASIATPSLVVSTLADTIGASLRNLQASFKDTKEFNQSEERLLHALSKSLKSMCEKPSNESCFATIDNLYQVIEALSDIKASNDQISKDVVTGSKPFAKTASLVTIPFIGTLISGLQLSVDSALGLVLAKDAMEQNLNFVNPKALSKKASSLDVKAGQAESGTAHSQNISSLTARFKHINQALRIAVKQHERLKSDSDASSALVVGNILTLSASIGLALPVLLTELGSITHETAAGIRFSNGSSDQIIKQSKIVSLSDDKVGEELDRLFSAASEMQDALEMAERFGDSSPVSLGVSRSTAVGGVVGTLATLAGAYSGIKEMKSALNMLKMLPERSELKVEEKEHAKGYAIESKKSHQKSSAFSTTSAPEKLTAESALEAIFRKVVLTERISDTDAGEAKERKDLNSVGKVSVGAENSFATFSTHSSEFLTGAMYAVSLAFLESGISAEAIFRSMHNAIIETAQVVSHTSHTLSDIKDVSEGPDKIKLSNKSQTNLSFLSNALRILAERQSKDSEFLGSTAVSLASGLESTFSRTLTIFLMHSGILKEALFQLTNAHLGPEEHSLSSQPTFSSRLPSDEISFFTSAGEQSKSVRRTKASAREEVISQLARVIKEKLEDNPIPGLNDDMAMAMQSFSQQRIVSALTSEMTLIEPFLVLSGILNEASQKEHHKDEALTGSEISKNISMVSNLLQGFTLASLKESEPSGYNPNEINQSLFKTHDSFRNSTKTTYFSTGSTSLTLVETLSALVGRSFSLLDSADIRDKSVNISEQATDELKLNLDLSTAEVKADSRLDEPSAAIHSTSAMRSSLTHFSAALKQSADEIAAAVQKTQSDDFVKGDLRMHTSQAYLMRCVATAFSTCAHVITRALAVSSGLSFLHIISLGQVDKAHDFSHSSDETLNLKQNDSSQTSTKGCGSDTSLVTGLSTDLVASTITNLIKILLKASLLGSDVLLSVSKVLEILVVDVHPEKRLKHEMQALSLPAIGTSGSMKSLCQMIQALKIISTISVGQGCVTHNDELLKTTLESMFVSLQKEVNNGIDKMNVLADSESEQNEREEKEHKMDLKEFVRQMLNTMSPGLSPETADMLIDRYNKGGITLTAYHDNYGGMLNTSESKTHIRHPSFNKIDNVQGLIDRFIHEMFTEQLNFMKRKSFENPLKKFNEQIGGSLTTNAADLHKYIIEGVGNKLAETFNLTKSSLLHGPRIAFERDNFIREYSLNSIVKPESTSAKEQKGTKIESLLSQVEKYRSGMRPT